MAAVKPWRGAHTIACLWMLAGILAVLWVAGLVTEYQARLDWSQVQPRPVKPVPASACFTKTRGAFCP